MRVAATNVTTICFVFPNLSQKAKKKRKSQRKFVVDNRTKKRLFSIRRQVTNSVECQKPSFRVHLFRFGLIFMEKCKKTIDK